MGRRRRRWERVSWWFSLLLVVPVVGFLGTFGYQQFVASRGIQGVVVDAYTGEPVPAATITTGDQRIETSGDGEFSVPRGTTEVTVEKAGYATATMPVGEGVERIDVRLRPNVVRGTISNRATGEPIAGVTVELKVADRSVDTKTTDQSGAFQFSDVPDGASLALSSPDFEDIAVDLTRKTEVEIALRPDVVTGTVTDDAGQPVDGALIAIGDAQTTSGADGMYRLENAPESGNIVFKAPGHRAVIQPLDSSLRVDARLPRFTAKALYATAETASNPEAFARLLDIIDRTELNAIVVDLKDSSGFVFYDTRVSLAHEIDAVRPVLDVEQILDQVHERDLYAIARIVVFEDPILAEARPEWAIQNAATGDLWRTWNGLAWVNAHRSEVWEYNTNLAREAADLGFDEVQLDYIRFPSDGPLDEAEYGVEHNQDTRPAAIRDFLTGVHDALAATPAYLGVDVFGLTMWELGDSGIGQHLESIAPVVDYVCPMVYPSHFYSGSMGFDIPNDHPYEVILWSLQAGAERLSPADARKLRPWLQDFSLGPGVSYGDEEVRQQIRAAEEFGSSGWMLWNAANMYHDGALKPE